MVARKQSLSLSKRPEVIVIKKPTGNLIPDMVEVENDQPGAQDMTMRILSLVMVWSSIVFWKLLMTMVEPPVQGTK